MSESICVTIPLRLVSLTNMRAHWAAKHRHIKAQREAALAVPMPSFDAPYRVTITRIGKRKMDDDNLKESAKGLRDGIADRLGLDDGDLLITWIYRQEFGMKRDYAVRVEIERRS